MGSCLSSSSSEDDLDFHDASQMEKSKVIEKELRRYRQDLEKEVKILLLGAGESGKTTILKVSRVQRSFRRTDSQANAIDTYRWISRYGT